MLLCNKVRLLTTFAKSNATFFENAMFEYCMAWNYG